jgi:hypothetical protein
MAPVASSRCYRFAAIKRLANGRLTSDRGGPLRRDPVFRFRRLQKL